MPAQDMQLPRFLSLLTFKPLANDAQSLPLLLDLPLGCLAHFLRLIGNLHM